ncbi:hypothetical protein FACS189496_2210 [Bacilli bacterium]|nr:hypothetical protein FACS189496_2210 [Bacilli bacterium]
MFCSKGGSVALLANWTKTGAESLGNLLVVITTKGEVLVFSGTDPSAIDLDPAKWNFEGKFEIPAVLPDSNAVRVGGDLVIMTVEGYIGLGDLLNASFINTDKALSNKIDAAVKEVVRFKDFQHWNLTFSIGENILIANVPRTKNLGKYKTDQHVLNLSTGAWCRFVGLDATCFVTFRDSIYFGKVEGGLFEMFKGDTDAGQYIKGYVQQAYSNFGSPKIKTFKRMDIIASNSLGINFAMNFSVDFRRAANNANVSVTPIGATWDNTVWDTSLWNSGGVSRLVPTVINANSGVFGSVGISVYTNYSDIKWYSTILTMSIAK